MYNSTVATCIIYVHYVLKFFLSSNNCLFVVLLGRGGGRGRGRGGPGMGGYPQEQQHVGYGDSR